METKMSKDDLKAALMDLAAERIENMSAAVRAKRGSTKFLACKARRDVLDREYSEKLAAYNAA